MNGIEIITQERIEQITGKGFDAEHDAKINNQFQLTQAAQVLSKLKMSTNDSWEPPFGWDEEWWIRLCNKPYTERVAIAGAFMAAELDRIKFITDQGIDYKTLKPLKEAED